MEKITYTRFRPTVILDVYVLAQNIKTGVYRVCDEIFARIQEKTELNVKYIVREDLRKEAEAYLNNLLDEYILTTYEAGDPSEYGDILLSPFGVTPDNWRNSEKLLHAHIIYDLIAIRRPGFFTPEGATEVSNIIGSLRSDTLIFAISEYTKTDLLFFRPDIKPDNVVVIPLAANDTFKPCTNELSLSKVQEKYGIPNGEPYVLSLATLEIRKNLHQVVRAFIKYLDNNPDKKVNLVLSGMSGWKLDKLNHELSNAGQWRSRIILTGFVDDRDLSALYSGALCFLYLSRYEGFGLPPLEAMACGTPVISSNNSSLPEVVGDAALTVGADDTDAAADAIEKLAHSEELRKKLSIKGLQRANTFDWSRTTALVADSLEGLYAQKSNHSDKVSSELFNGNSKFENGPVDKLYPRWVDTVTGKYTYIMHGGLRLKNTHKADVDGFPLVSYVTVVKNNVKDISRTIKSVQDQTYGNVEHIIVDGESTDGTVEAIERYADSIDYYISEPDTGLYNALNKAIQLSRGGLICVLNSDDWLMPDSAEIAVAHVASVDSRTILCSAAKVVDKESQLYWKPSTVHSGCYFTCANVCHNALYATRKAYEIAGLYDDTYEIAADFEWIMRAFDSGVKFIYSDKPTVYYSLGGVSSNFLTHSMECMRVSHRRFPYLTRSEINGLYHAFFLFHDLSYRYDIDRPKNRGFFINELFKKYNNKDFRTALSSAREHSYGPNMDSFNISLKHLAVKYLRDHPKLYSIARKAYRRIKHFR